MVQETGREIATTDRDGKWEDVLLPPAAMSSGKLEGLIGFQEFLPNREPALKKKKQKPAKTKKRKLQKNAVLFGEEVSSVEEETVARPSEAKKTKKEAPKKTEKPKKQQKKSKAKSFELTEEEKAVSNGEYVFQNKLPEWRRFNLDVALLRAIDSLGFRTPTDIQRQCVPKGLNTKKTILGAAETGSGKTIAYALPILQKIIGYLGESFVEVFRNFQNIKISIITIFSKRSTVIRKRSKSPKKNRLSTIIAISARKKVSVLKR
jgi:hypothetical protein